MTQQTSTSWDNLINFHREDILAEISGTTARITESLQFINVTSETTIKDSKLTVIFNTPDRKRILILKIDLNLYVDEYSDTYVEW